MIAGLLCHAAGQLRVLKYALMNHDENSNANVTNESMEKNGEDNDDGAYLYRRISECVQHYDDIFEFVRCIEDTYSFVVFGQFIASTIVICISCLQMSEVNLRIIFIERREPVAAVELFRKQIVGDRSTKER
nr:unnamed protein product [Callosobruchus analis]